MSSLLLLLLVLPACFQNQPAVDDSAGNGGDDSNPDSSDTDTGSDSDSDSDNETDTSQPIESVLDIDITAPSATDEFDECLNEICFAVTVIRTDSGSPVPAEGASVDIEVKDVGYVNPDHLIADANGEVSVCTAGLPVGTLDFAVTATDGVRYEETDRAYGSFIVRPFGFALGMTRSEEVVTSLPWTPVMTKYAGNPVLPANREDSSTTPNPDVYDYVGTFIPTVVMHNGRYYMWFAGQQVANGDYFIGEAESNDGLRWTKHTGGEQGDGWSDLVSPGEDPTPDPTVEIETDTGTIPDPDTGDDTPEDDWKLQATNSPVLVYEESTSEWQLFYTGRRDSTGHLSIGLATSTQYNEEYGSGGDAYNVEDLPNAYTGSTYTGGPNPVFEPVDEDSAWAGDAVAHPSVLKNDQGYYELWYSTGRHRVGYAMSTDRGRSWNRYCKNPVLTGDGTTWEYARIKSTEVAYYDGYYIMSYTGGDTGYFQIGWAMSKDGLHWLKAPEPILSPNYEDRTSWEYLSTIGGCIVVDEDTGMLRMWYGGSNLFTSGEESPGGSAIGYAESPLPASLP